MTTRILLPAILSLGLLAACGGGGDAESTGGGTPPAETAADAWPAGLFTDAAPADAIGVAAAKATAQEGEVVVVRGRVGGPIPFIEGRAVMTLADTEQLVACSDRPADSCPEPWDYCCESSDKIAANSLTVQVVDPDGRPLKAGLKGAGGIDPLDFVVVTGTVGPRPDPGVLVIDATSIHVEN